MGVDGAESDTPSIYPTYPLTLPSLVSVCFVPPSEGKIMIMALDHAPGNAKQQLVSNFVHVGLLICSSSSNIYLLQLSPPTPYASHVPVTSSPSLEGYETHDLRASKAYRSVNTERVYLTIFLVPLVSASGPRRNTLFCPWSIYLRAFLTASSLFPLSTF